MIVGKFFTALATCTFLHFTPRTSYNRTTKLRRQIPTIPIWSPHFWVYVRIRLRITFSFSRRNGRALRRTPVRQHSFYLHSQSLLLSKNRRSRSICTVFHSTLDISNSFSIFRFLINKPNCSVPPSHFNVTCHWMLPCGSLSYFAFLFPRIMHVKRARTCTNVNKRLQL